MADIFYILFVCDALGLKMYYYEQLQCNYVAYDTFQSRILKKKKKFENVFKLQ